MHFSKALYKFKLPHNKLLYKLFKYGILSKFHNWTRDFFKSKNILELLLMEYSLRLLIHLVQFHKASLIKTVNVYYPFQ